MKRFILSFFGVVFPFVVFLFLDLPGAAIIALGLQTTMFGWPIAMIWAFKHIAEEVEKDKIKKAAAKAAAEAEATAKVRAEVEEKLRKEAEQKEAKK